jgi:hypothetical protein
MKGKKYVSRENLSNVMHHITTSSMAFSWSCSFGSHQNDILNKQHVVGIEKITDSWGKSSFDSKSMI